MTQACAKACMVSPLNVANLAFLLRVAMIWDKVAAPEADSFWKL